jgi:EAL domain-containing protein (putative c-di-GMP-specific phosphodiesterase class I)
MQDKTPVTPSIFLHSAKQSHYYFDMSKTIIKESFELADKNSIPISINLSILDLQKPSMRSYIKRILESFEKIANLITFEILEDYPIESIGIIRHFLQNIKEMGATIAIDDFGSGYSNYQRLLYFHPDIIKIDGSLIKDILTNSFSQSMVKSIVTFAKEQNLKTVAEFVENEEIYNMLKTLGVDYSQGYYFGKPAPVEEYIPTNKEE